MSPTRTSPSGTSPSGTNPRRRQAPIAATWWSQRFTTVLEGYGLGARMERGRRYARGGHVLSLEVAAGLLESRVQGSRRTPYRVTVQSKVPTPNQWRTIERVFGERIGWAARLLAGEVPCKHIAASLYVFALRLDGDPLLLLAWRGREREVLLETVRPAAMTAAATPRLSGLPPWWPEGLSKKPDTQPGRPQPQPPDPPARVLERLGPLVCSGGEAAGASSSGRRAAGGGGYGGGGTGAGLGEDALTRRLKHLYEGLITPGDAETAGDDDAGLSPGDGEG